MSKKRPQRRAKKNVGAAKGAAGRRLRDMEDFHCEQFDLYFESSGEDFDKEAFLKDIGVEDESEHIDEDGDVALFVSFASRSEPPKQHAHLKLYITPEQKVKATINYHEAGPKVPDNKPPYLEECTQWLSRYLKTDEFKADYNVLYNFDEGFAPTIPLPFPLVASSKALSGLKVSGLSLEFPPDAQVESAIIQRSPKDVFLFFQGELALKLKDFDLYAELDKLSATVNSLVQRQEKKDGSTEQKAET